MAKTSVTVDLKKQEHEDLLAAKEAADNLTKMYGVRIGALETYMSAADRLTWRLSQADALLTVATAFGAETFHNFTQSIKDNYLSAVQNLVSAAHADATAWAEERTAK